MSATLNELGQDAYDSAKANGWHDRRPDENFVLRETSTPERLALIHSEVSEALEAFRRQGAAGYTDSLGKPEGLGSELADIIIRTVELAHIWEIDLDQDVAEKMMYNAHRNDVPARQGGKSI